MQEEKKGGSAMVWTVSVIIVALLAFGGYKYMNKSSAVVETPVFVPTVPDTTGTPPAQAMNTYKDGSYSAVGDYVSPGGAETVAVSLTLSGGVVTDATVTGQATRPESKNWQGKFISGYKTLVIGKKIDEIALTKVSGSSLTPKGFNDALAKIKVQAKA